MEKPYDSSLKSLNALVGQYFEIVSKRSDGYSEEYMSCLREVERTRMRLDLAKGLLADFEDGTIYIDNFLSVQHSAVAVSAITFIELGRASRREGEYDKALNYYSRAVDDYSDAVFQSVMFDCDDAWPTAYANERRFSRFHDQLMEGVSDLTFQEIADTFDALKNGGGSDDYDWSQIANDCASLRRAPLDIFGDRYDRDIETLSETVLVSDSIDKGDSLGWRATWNEYWPWADGSASGQLSQSEFFKWREREEKHAAENRLKNYFFGDNWQILPDRAQKRLINADVVWNSPQRMAREAILNDLLRATEEMCYEFIWKPLSESKESSLEFLKFEARATDRHSTPSSRHYVDLCKQRFFHDHLRRQKLSDEEFRLLSVTLPNLLGQLIDRRNPAEHETGSTTPIETVEDCYKTFLGIGKRGVLPEFARIGRKLRGGRRGRR